MKKLSLLFMMLAFAVVTQAGEPLKMASKNMVKNAPGLRFENKKLSKPGNVALRAPHKAPITEQPEGEVEYYARSTAGSAILVVDGYIDSRSQSGIYEIVRAADDANKVYIKNILFGIGGHFGDSWVEGSLSADGTKLTVPVGQSLYWSETYQADVLLCWGSTSIDEGTFVLTVDDTVQEITYTVDPAAKTITLDNSVAPVDNGDSHWEYCATGPASVWADDGSFGGFLEWNTVWTYKEGFEVPEPIYEQPEGELTTYVHEGVAIQDNLFLGPQNAASDVVFGNNGDVYIKDLLSTRANGTWVKGTYDAASGIISIPVGQYISWSDTNGYGMQLMWGSVAEIGEDVNYEIDESVENILLKVEGDVITLMNSEGEGYNAAGILGVWNDDLSFAGFDYGTVLRKATPLVPADPVVKMWYDSGDEDGLSYLTYLLPTTDVDGNELTNALLSYSVYTDDDQIFTFDADLYYRDLTEDVTEIPATLTGYDFDYGKVYFYRTNAANYDPFFTERIGIQAHYTVSGVKNSSEIVYVYPFGPPTAIRQAVSEVEPNGAYYNVMGQKLDKRNLPAGIYIHNGKKVIMK